MLKDFIRRRFFTAIVFGIALLVLLIIGLLSVIYTQSWIANRQQVSQTRNTLLDYEKLLSYLKDAETGQRGYVLMGDSTYLAPYAMALDSLENVLNRINDLSTGADSVRGNGILAISLLTNQRLAILKSGIELRNREGLPATVEWIRNNRGKSVMDSLRRQVTQLQAHENLLLDTQTADLSRRTGRVFTVQFIGTCISILLLVWAFWYVWQQLDQRRKDLLALEDYSHNLESKVQERTNELHASLEELNASNEELTALVEKLTQVQEQLIEEQQKTEQALGIVKRENDRKTQELEEARSLQMSMLPQNPPLLDNMDIAMFMETCTEVGGDYYDYKLDDDGTLTFVVGDATGHGLKAGIVVATVKSYFQTLANQRSEVEMLQQISEGIQNLQIRAMYMGLTIIKIKDNELTMASSGMPPAYLYRHAKREVEPILLKGIFLGSELQIPYRLTSVKMQPGDALLLMTDGLPELFNDRRETLDYARIENHYRKIAYLPAEQIVQELLALGKAWSRGNANEDDVTVVVVKAK